MELARQVTWSDTRVELFHYRTRDKVEVDVVLENRQGKVVGVEVKAASTVGLRRWRPAASRQSPIANRQSPIASRPAQMTRS
jgi:predicted AAA+ superfamily ATPase